MLCNRLLDEHGGVERLRRNMVERCLLEFCNENEICAANTWFNVENSNMVTNEICM